MFLQEREVKELSGGQATIFPKCLHICSPLNTYSCPCGSAGKESACNVGDLGLIPELGRSPGEGKGYLILYSPWVHKELDATEPLALPCKYIFALILEALVISILRVSPRAICTLK